MSIGDVDREVVRIIRKGIRALFEIKKVMISRIRKITDELVPAPLSTNVMINFFNLTRKKVEIAVFDIIFLPSNLVFILFVHCLAPSSDYDSICVQVL